MNFFLKYWSPIISTFALSLSFYASIVTWYARFKKPVITIKWIYKIDTQYNICMSIYNASSKPLTLQKTNLIISGKNTYFPVDFPLVLIEVNPLHTIKKDNGFTPIAYIEDSPKHFFSSDLPINLDPYKSKKIILPFQFVNEQIEELDPLKCDLHLTFNKNKEVGKIINVKKLMIDQKQFIRYGNSMIR